MIEPVPTHLAKMAVDPENGISHAHEADLNRARFETLYQLSKMYDEPEKAIKDFALEAAVQMTQSTIGYIYFMNEDETVLSIHAWSKGVMPECAIVEPQTEYLVSETGLWGEAARQRRPIITNDYAAPNPYKKGIPEGHVSLKRHMNLPLIDEGKIILIVGVGNKETPYDEEDVQHLTLIMDSMWRLVKQKRLTAALQESEARYRAIFTQAANAIALTDVETGKIVAFNQQMHDMLGYTRAEFAQLEIADLEALESSSAIAAHIQKILHTGKDIFETCHRTKQGDIRDILINAQLTWINEKPLIQTVLVDITEQKQAKRLLHIQKDLAVKLGLSTSLPDMLDTLLTVIIGWDKDLDCGAVYLFDEQTGKPYLAQAKGFNPEAVPENPATLADICMCKAEFRLPVYYEARPIAELVFGSNERGEISKTVQNILPMLASQIGGPIAHARSQDALRASQQRYADLVDTIDGIVWQADALTFQFQFVSKPVEQILGYPMERWLNEPTFWVDHIYKADRAWVFPYCIEAVQNLRDYEFECRMVAADGRIVWVHNIVNTISREKRPYLLYGVMIDITKRKQSDETLRQLSRAVEQSPASIVITNTDGIIEYVNPKFTRATGYTKEEAVGQTPAILKSGLTTLTEYQELWQTIGSGKEWRGEFYNKRKNGTYFWESASISPIFGDDNQITHYLGVKEDITEQKLLEKQLRQRNNELTLLNRAGQALGSTLELDQVLAILLNETRHLLQITAGAVWFLDGESGDLVCQQVTGQPMNPLLNLHHPITDDSNIGWVARSGQSLIIVDSDQAETPIFAIEIPHIGFEPHACLLVPLLIQQKTIGVFQVLDAEPGRFTQHECRLIEAMAAYAANAVENAQLHEDLQNQLTRLKETQTRLLQSEKLAAMGELIAGVAHELNNPLTSMVLYSQLLQSKGVDKELVQDLNLLVAQARRASNVVRGLLDFARQRAPERIPTQINDILTGTLDFLTYELRMRNMNVLTQLASDLPFTMADPHQLQQVFFNLINNALHAMDQIPTGGQLTLTTLCTKSQFYADTKNLNSMIRIIIQDNGPGIPPEFITRIFDPFFTTKRAGEGTGLGLSVCHGIITEHEGHIWVESKQQKGTTFFIELPIVNPAPAQQPDAMTEESDQANTQSARRILVVDDEESILIVVSRVLRRQGYYVDGVISGEAALDNMAKASYDLILSDLRMPGMSGAKFFQRAKVIYPDIGSKVIFTTGDIVHNDMQDFLDQIGAPCLTKPFEVVELLTAVRQKIDSKLD